LVGLRCYGHESGLVTNEVFNFEPTLRSSFPAAGVAVQVTPGAHIIS